MPTSIYKQNTSFHKTCDPSPPDEYAIPIFKIFDFLENRGLSKNDGNKVSFFRSKTACPTVVFQAGATPRNYLQNFSVGDIAFKIQLSRLNFVHAKISFDFISTKHFWFIHPESILICHRIVLFQIHYYWWNLLCQNCFVFYFCSTKNLQHV